MKTKEDIISDLRAFVAQRSGIDVNNYVSPGRADLDGWRALQADRRLIGQQGRDARALLAYVEASGIDAESLARPLTGGGRLSYEGGALTYTAGQYFATEFRAAVCSALASVLWRHWASGVNLSAAQLRQAAFRTFGRGLAKRWFN
jgi:hypothetical protein